MKYPSHDLHSLSKSGQTRSCLCYDNGRRVDARHNNNDDTTKTYTSSTSRSKVFSVCEPFVLKLPGCHFLGYITWRYMYYSGEQTKNSSQRKKSLQRKFFAKKRMQRKQRKILLIKSQFCTYFEEKLPILL